MTALFWPPAMSWNGIIDFVLGIKLAPGWPEHLLRLVRRLKRRNPHSISVFIHDDGTVDLIPAFYTKDGFGRETDFFAKSSRHIHWTK